MASALDAAVAAVTASVAAVFVVSASVAASWAAALTTVELLPADTVIASA